MLQIIGLMIAIYIEIRLVSFGTRSGERAENAAVRVLAWVGFVVVGILTLMLLASGGGAEAFQRGWESGGR